MFEAASLPTRQEYSSGYVHTAVLYSILLGFRIFGNAARASDRTQSIAGFLISSRDYRTRFRETIRRFRRRFRLSGLPTCRIASLRSRHDPMSIRIDFVHLFS